MRRRSAPFGGDAAVVVTVKDQAIGRRLVRERPATPGLTRGDVQRRPILTPSPARASDPRVRVAVNDKVMLVGTDAAVKAAIDSNGRGQARRRPRVQGRVRRSSPSDYVGFRFTRLPGARWTSSLRLPRSAPAARLATAIDDELVSPRAGLGGHVGRFENDALVGRRAAYPSRAIGYDGEQPKSTLARPRPAGHDRSTPRPTTSARPSRDARAFRESARAPRGLDAGRRGRRPHRRLDGDLRLVGRHGRRRRRGCRREAVGGGLARSPRRTPPPPSGCSTTLRSFVALAGGAGGRHAPRRRSTATRRSRSSTSRSAAGVRRVATLPPGSQAGDRVCGHRRTSWSSATARRSSSSVLDAGPGPSLGGRRPRSAGSSTASATRTSACQLRRHRARSASSSSRWSQDSARRSWAQYETEIKPFLMPFDAFIAAARKDGDLDRGSPVITVK